MPKDSTAKRGGGSLQPDGSARWWIAERCCRARKTIVVKARSRAEAQAKLDAGEGEGVDIHYYAIERAKVVREDKAQNAPDERRQINPA